MVFNATRVPVVLLAVVGRTATLAATQRDLVEEAHGRALAQHAVALRQIIDEIAARAHLRGNQPH